MPKPISTVQLGIARLGIEIGDRANDADLAAWVRSFHRALALMDGSLNAYAAELIEDVEEYRAAESKRKLKVPPDSTGKTRIPPERHGFPRLAADSEHSQSFSQSDNKETPSPTPPMDRVDRCISLYPQVRKPQDREREKIIWGNKDVEKLLAAIEADPVYPFEFVFSLESKKTRDVKSPSNFLDNLPAPKMLVDEMRKSLEEAAAKIKAEHPEFPESGYATNCVPFMDAETLTLLAAFRKVT